MQKTKERIKKERREVFNEIVEAFGVKYSWLGSQTARELLISAASWNIHRHSNPHFRMRNHVMLAWRRGFLKSTMMRVMADILGERNTSVIGKVSDAAMRGSVSGGSFTPPKPLKSPIVISTEFGQTDFSDELLNLFLALLEEGHTNVALNKIAQLSDNQRQNIESKYDNQINFQSNNEFDLRSDFIFWGATYDPSMLSDDALRSRLNVVTPIKPLNYKITKALDSNPPVKKQLRQSTVKKVRKFIRDDREFPIKFKPPDPLYEEYNIEPRETRDIQSRMACRNWWGLSTTPDVMSDYVEYLKESRRLATMDPEDRVFDLIFDNPMTYSEMMDETGMDKTALFKILKSIDAQRDKQEKELRWVVWSGSQQEVGKDEFLSGMR